MARPKVPATFLADLDPADVAGRLFGDERSIALQIAVSTVQSYLTEAGVQQVRIQRAHRDTRRMFARLQAQARARTAAPTPPRSRSQQGLFRAVHFYLICWRIVERYLKVIQRVSGLPSVERALRPHLPTFKKYGDIRDHYEHLDERLPGQRNVHRLAVRNDLGNLNGNTFTLGGQAVDVGPQSLRLLRRIVAEVLKALKSGAVEKLLTNDPEQVRGLAASVRAKKVYRHLRRMFPQVPRQPGLR